MGVSSWVIPDSIMAPGHLIPVGLPDLYEAVISALVVYSEIVFPLLREPLECKQATFHL